MSGATPAGAWGRGLIPHDTVIGPHCKSATLKILIFIAYKMIRLIIPRRDEIKSKEQPQPTTPEVMKVCSWWRVERNSKYVRDKKNARNEIEQRVLSRYSDGRTQGHRLGVSALDSVTSRTSPCRSRPPSAPLGRPRPGRASRPRRGGSPGGPGPLRREVRRTPTVVRDRRRGRSGAKPRALGLFRRQIACASKSFAK